MTPQLANDGEVYRPDLSLKGKLRRRIVRLQHRRAVQAPRVGPMISFSFDDAPDTAFSVGAKLLEARGLRGTFFVCAGLIGDSGHMGPYATRDQVVQAAAMGHEIACHSYSHLDCGQAKAADIAHDLDRNSQAFAALGLPQPTTFAFPYGDVSAQAKHVAGDRFRLCRALHHGVVKPGADLNQAPAVGIEGDDGEAVARRWMQTAARQGAWLILYTHILGSTPTEFGCTVEGFARLVDEAIAGGFHIVTVERGAAMLGHTQ
jgi:peptidoglycan/xylan/chitin deacetylase (PgdA/CDA1 family)